MRTLLMLLCTAAALVAQTVQDAHAAVKSAVLTSTPAVTITATQGDGGSCVLTKLQGGQINLGVTCSSTDGKTVKRTTITSQSTAAKFTDILFGDVFCLLVTNPTAAAVTMGSVGPAPPKGIAWSCTTGITDGGSTALVAGAVSWP